MLNECAEIILEKTNSYENALENCVQLIKASESLKSVSTAERRHLPFRPKESN